MLDGLLHPTSSIPFVQMGRSIALYMVSLLSRDSCERVFISQLMLLSLSSSWHHLAFMCVSTLVSCLGEVQGILLLFLTSMGVLWRFTGGQMSRRVVNVTCADLV